MSATDSPNTSAPRVEPWLSTTTDGVPADYLVYAEDNPTDAIFFKRAIASTDYNHPILHLEDGLQVRQHLENCLDKNLDLPRLLVLDIKMPGMTGLELLEWIREDERLAYLPTVLLSASYEKVDLKRAYHHRVNAYLVKPNRYSDLKQLAQSLLTFWGRFNETIHP